eukprot:Sro1809_g299040.1 n/a (371) ;mRNA; r:3778-4890
MQRSSSNPNLMDNLKAHSTKNDLLKGNGSSHHSRNPHRRRASMDTNTMQRSSSNPNLMDGLKSRSSSRLRRASSNRKLMDQKQQQHNQQQQQEPSSKPTSRRSSMARPRSNPNLMKAATTNTTNKNGCPRRASSNGDLTLLKKKTDSNPNLLGHQRRVSSKTTATNPAKKDSKQPRRCHSRAQSFDESKDTGKILPNWRRRSKSSQEEDDESDESEHNNKRDPVAMYNRVRQRVTAAMREDRSIDDIDSSVDDIDMSAVSRDISWGDVSDSDIDLSVANLHMAKNAGCHGSSREFLTSNSLLNLGLQGDFLCRTKLDSEDKTDNPHTDSGRGRRQKAKQAKPQPMTKLDQVMAIQRNWKSASNQLAHVTL